MANDISLDTLQNNVKKVNVIIYMVVALMLIGIGAAFASKGTGPAIFGGLVSIGVGSYTGYLGYDILVNPRNERKCSDRYFNTFENMKIPDAYVNGDADIDVDLDITREQAVSKLQYGTYGGVYLRSNVASESIGGNFDAYYIPGDAKATITRRATGNDVVAKFLYVIKVSGDKERAIIVKNIDSPKEARTNLPVPSPAPLITDPRNPCYVETVTE